MFHNLFAEIDKFTAQKGPLYPLHKLMITLPVGGDVEVVSDFLLCCFGGMEMVTFFF